MGLLSVKYMCGRLKFQNDGQFAYENKIAEFLSDSALYLATLVTIQ